MATLQIRIEDSLKEEASKLFEELGLDMSTAIRMFLRTCIRNGGIPLEMKTRSEKIVEDAKQAMKEIDEISEKNGNCNLTLDEINEIIRQVREERDKQ